MDDESRWEQNERISGVELREAGGEAELTTWNRRDWAN